MLRFRSGYTVATAITTTTLFVTPIMLSQQTAYAMDGKNTNSSQKNKNSSAHHKVKGSKSEDKSVTQLSENFSELHLAHSPVTNGNSRTSETVARLQQLKNELPNGFTLNPETVQFKDFNQDAIKLLRDAIHQIVAEEISPTGPQQRAGGLPPGQHYVVPMKKEIGTVTGPFPQAPPPEAKLRSHTMFITTTLDRDILSFKPGVDPS